MFSLGETRYERHFPKSRTLFEKFLDWIDPWVLFGIVVVSIILLAILIYRKRATIFHYAKYAVVVPHLLFRKLRILYLKILHEFE